MTANAITLDFIRDQAEQEFASLSIETEQGVLKLRNPLRLSKDERAELKRSQTAASEARKAKVAELEQYQADLQAYAEAENQAELTPPVEPPEADEDEQFDQISELLLNLADDRDVAKAFIASLNKDLVLISTVIKLYNKAVSPGEA